MFSRAAVLLFCVLVVTSEGVRFRRPNCSKYPGDGICPMIYDPVCGTDGITYGNECVMCFSVGTSKPKLRIKKRGECTTGQVSQKQ